MARNHKVTGPMRVIQWLVGKKNSYGNNIYQQAWRWLTNRHPDGTKREDTDTLNVMNQNGDFTYKDNTSGIVRLWNDITGKTNQQKDIALNNWTQQYNKPQHQKELELEAGYNPNLVAQSGVAEFTPQPIADTNSFNGVADSASTIMDLVGKAKGLKGLDLENASKTLDNLSKELDMPRKEVDNAIWSARKEPDRIANSIRRDLQSENINDLTIENAHDEAVNNKQALKVQNLLNRIADAVASDDANQFTEQDPYTDGYRLTQKGKERNRNKRDAENAQWLNEVAMSVRKSAEKSFYDETGKYPDWNVDVFDEEFNSQILGVLDKMDDGLAKTIVLGVISVIHSLTGSVGSNGFKVGF